MKKQTSSPREMIYPVHRTAHRQTRKWSIMAFGMNRISKTVVSCFFESESHDIKNKVSLFFASEKQTLTNWTIFERS